MSAKSSLAAFIRWVTRDYLYYGVFSATVQAPSSGDTVDLRPDDPRLQGTGLQGVPISYGLPDCKASILPGCRVLLMFENGDPQKPRASVFDGSALDIRLGGGTLPVGRVGDTVTVPAAGILDSLGLPCTGLASGIIAGGATKTKAG